MEDASRSPVLQILRRATRTLTAAGCDTPRLDAEVLLTHVLGQNRAWLYAHPDHVPPAPQLTTYQSLLCRRVQREPVAYLIGHKEFFDLQFTVTPDVLIPRPETEQLVEMALQWATNSVGALNIADVGTGSGAIGVALAVHLPEAHIIAIDASPATLAVAQRNAARHGVTDQLHCVQGNLLSPLAKSLHLIVANPPYLSQAELTMAPPEVAHWEPRAALDGGPDGLAIIRQLLGMASDRLRAGGALLVEIGARQGARVRTLAHHYFSGATVEIAGDYAGHDRLLVVHCA
jgi:release factor glutamine methyltransferase